MPELIEGQFSIHWLHAILVESPAAALRKPEVLCEPFIQIFSGSPDSFILRRQSERMAARSAPQLRGPRSPKGILDGRIVSTMSKPSPIRKSDKRC
jgi:hypothetical protein